MGGVKNSYNSYMKVIGNDYNKPSIVPGLSNIQLFFVAYAQVIMFYFLFYLSFIFYFLFYLFYSFYILFLFIFSSKFN